jgi:hypothetical protein
VHQAVVIRAQACGQYRLKRVDGTFVARGGKIFFSEAYTKGIAVRNGCMYGKQRGRVPGGSIVAGQLHPIWKVRRSLDGMPDSIRLHSRIVPQARNEKGLR